MELIFDDSMDWKAFWKANLPILLQRKYRGLLGAKRIRLRKKRARRFLGMKYFSFTASAYIKHRLTEPSFTRRILIPRKVL
jgi:hypothetical protein